MLAALDDAAAEPEVAAAQVGRDLDAGAHRTAMLTWFARVAFLAGIEEAARRPRGRRGHWVPYGDTGTFLAALADRGVPVGVVSDIGWDIRRHARAAGLLDLVGTWVLSCEEGCEKPAPELFRTACERLGADPRRTLMVGDNPVRDGGAVAAGLRAFVLAGEQRERERGLGDVLALVSARA